ncbi:MAG: sugar phosphate isomerase/epimerase family protein [Pirellulales bacterium]
MTNSLSRRDAMTAGLTLAVGAAAALQTSPSAATEGADPFRYCLNTSTIRGQELGIVREIEIASAAGYQGIEPWIRELDEYVKAGGSLPDLRKRIADAGLAVESAIGFATWIVDDDEQRRKGLEEARRSMELVAAIGGTRLAAPPVGATDLPKLDLFRAAERYGELLELGDKMGVVPQAEVWGFSKNLSRLGETAFVAIESGHPQACILPDIYHIHKGGSDFHGLKLLSQTAVHVFHVNDYPADPPRDTITDAHRVYPGDGAAPLTRIFQDLIRGGSRCVLSLELFNRDYWKQDALEVAKTGLAKTKAAVANAL